MPEMEKQKQAQVGKMGHLGKKEDTLREKKREGGKERGGGKGVNTTEQSS